MKPATGGSSLINLNQPDKLVINDVLRSWLGLSRGEQLSIAVSPRFGVFVHWLGRDSYKVAKKVRFLHTLLAPYQFEAERGFFVSKLY